jgi:hypothetical protein
MTPYLHTEILTGPPGVLAVDFVDIGDTVAVVCDLNHASASG